MTLSKLVLFLSISLLTTADLVSQTPAEAPPPPPPPVPLRIAVGDGAGEKAAGATVRGRLVYEDTGAPVRYAKIGFAEVGGRGYASDMVQTDENGNFVFEDLASGEYYPVVQNRGILNPVAFMDPMLSVAERNERLLKNFQKIAVAGTGEFEVFLRAKRGASISGVVRYFDGEPAVGVTVEALPVINGYPATRVFSGARSPNTEATDDRGYYRFAGLPEGQYVIRATEPVSHKNENVRFTGRGANPFSENPFQTYFPGGSSNKYADRIDAFYGQTTEGVNITLPERILYDISGIVIREDTRQPLKNFSVTFSPIANADDSDLGELQRGNATRIASFVMRSYTRTNYGEEQSAEFSLLNLPPGKYRLTATQQVPYRESDRKDAAPGLKKQEYPTVTKDVEIVGGNLENVLIEIPVGASLAGEMVSESGIRVDAYHRLVAVNEETGQLQLSRFIQPEAGSSDSTSGLTFEFNRMTAGRYKIGLSSAKFYIREVRIGSTPQSGNIVEIENGKDLANLKVILANDLGIIKGSVRSFDAGKPTTVIALEDGMDVVTALTGNGARSSQVKDDGSFEIKAAPGNYSLIVMSRGSAPRDPAAFLAWFEELRAKASSTRVGPDEIVSVTLDLP